MKNELFEEALTNNDLKTIETYVSTFSNTSSPDMKAFLRGWKRNKENLFSLLGNNLTYKIPIEEDGEIFHGMIKQTHDADPNNFSWYLTVLNREFLIDILNCPSNATSLNDLFSLETFLNKTTVNDITFYLPDEFILKKGIKPMKGLQKVVKQITPLLNDKSVKAIEKCVENIRIGASKITQNTWTSDTYLYFSIHPMDYITMSDNDNGWSSCMNWINGSICLGTYELMTSPNVIICYIAKENSNISFGKGDSLCTWNNKIWRCLFVADENYIISGKNYPNENKTYTDFAMKQLLKLYNSCSAYSPMVDRPVRDYDRHEDVIINTCYMYNDFEESNYSYYRIVDRVKAEPSNNQWRSDEDYNDRITLDIYGEVYCLECGQELVRGDNHSTYYGNTTNRDFICERCYRDLHSNLNMSCTNCDRNITNENKVIKIEDKKYCLDCFSEMRDGYGHYDVFKDKYVSYYDIPDNDKIKVYLVEKGHEVDYDVEYYTYFFASKKDLDHLPGIIRKSSWDGTEHIVYSMSKAEYKNTVKAKWLEISKEHSHLRIT